MHQQWLLKAIVALGAACAVGAAMAAEPAAKVPVDLSPDEVLTRLKTIDAGKDQYETKAAYTKRLCEATVKALGGNKDLTLRMDASTPHYNADTRVLYLNVEHVIHINFSDPPNYGDHWTVYDDTLFTIELTAKYIPGASYVGSNAFGATREVNGRVKESAVIRFPAKSTDALRSSVYFSLPLPSEIARQVASDLRVAAVVKITEPCLSLGKAHDRPTISNPTETS